jgi:hypothetical protein
MRKTLWLYLNGMCCLYLLQVKPSNIWLKKVLALGSGDHDC